MTQTIKTENKNQNKGHNGRPVPFVPKTKEDQLALDIARAFNDEKHLPMYRFFCGKYHDSVIRKAFSEAKSYPEEKINKSRPALFIYLIKKHAKTNN
jgi:hypothetical protein